MENQGSGPDPQHTYKPQVPAAVPKVQHQQSVDETQQEQKVRKDPGPVSQWPEKAVPEPQASPHGAADEKLPGLFCRGRHRNRRPSQPPGALGSS